MHSSVLQQTMEIVVSLKMMIPRTNQEGDPQGETKV